MCLREINSRRRRRRRGSSSSLMLFLRVDEADKDDSGEGKFWGWYVVDDTPLPGPISTVWGGGGRRVVDGNEDSATRSTTRLIFTRLPDSDSESASLRRRSRQYSGLRTMRGANLEVVLATSKLNEYCESCRESSTARPQDTSSRSRPTSELAYSDSSPHAVTLTCNDGSLVHESFYKTRASARAATPKTLSLVCTRLCQLICKRYVSTILVWGKSR